MDQSKVELSQVADETIELIEEAIVETHITLA